MRSITSESKTEDLNGVGQQVAKKLQNLGIDSVGDLIEYFPRKYDDFSKVQKISRIKPGPVTIKAQIKQANGRYVRRGMHITEAIAADETGSVRLIWFNQPYRANNIKKGEDYYISGEFALRRSRLNIQNPSVELASSFNVNTARIVPVYKATKGIKNHQIRKLMANALEEVGDIEETLPEWLLKRSRLMERDKAIRTMHFPAGVSELARAKQRLGFDEVFELSLAALLNKQQIKSEHALKIAFSENLAKQFVSGLPFELTDAQRRAIWQILLDMQKKQPMNRLLEGDVGSGKTVVAAMVSAIAVENGYQVALMAPTEILARQHANTLFDLLGSIDMSDKVMLLVGGMNKSQKEKAKKQIASGRGALVVGTHALIQENVKMAKLGLVIVDEQHRFGVAQRKQLQQKAGHMPHVLAMTATPIPRSLALTLYGELDITLLDAKPAGRKIPITKLCSPNSKKQLFEKISSELDGGRQMFVVCPLISPSDNLQVQSIEEVYEELKKSYLKNRKIGLLHGKMKPAEKDKMMKKFQNKEIDVLVSTTVIEVGVDVPNATVMLIIGAERFGLAQIHQLRGRVGRAEAQGYCYLMMSDSSQPSSRLRALEHTTDGFKLAELDLSIRGPGAIYGTMQHGALDLRVANLADTKLIVAARSYAKKYIDKEENLVKYPQLKKRVDELRALTNLN